MGRRVFPRLPNAARSHRRANSKKHRNSLKLRGPSSSCGHCAFGELCKGLKGSLELFSSGFLGDGDPERAAGTFLMPGEAGRARVLAKPGGDLMALLRGASGGRSASGSSGARAAEASLGGFLVSGGAAPGPPLLGLCFMSS